MSFDAKCLSLPFIGLPQEWQEKERLDVLFGPVRNKNVNSFDWDSKLKFWKESIEAYSKHYKVYIFSLSELEKTFRRERGSPACLKDILEDLIESGDVMLLTDFQKKIETTWSGWLANTLVKKPLSWTFKKMKNSVVTVDLSNIEYLHIKVVEQEANKLLREVPDEMNNKLLEIEDFAKSIHYNELKSLKVLMQYLAREERVYLKDCFHGGKHMTLLKFSTMPKPIHDIDQQIYILRKEEELLQNKITLLEEKIVDLRKKAKEHVVQGHKHLARIVLTKKKLEEKSIETFAKNASNISTLLHNLENSAYNQEVYKTYKIAIDNLKMEQININDVDEAMADLNELVIANDELQSTLAKHLDEVQEQDLEDELMALMKETATETEVLLPSPPISPHAQKVEDEIKTEVPTQI